MELHALAAASAAQKVDRAQMLDELDDAMRDLATVKSLIIKRVAAKSKAEDQTERDVEGEGEDGETAHTEAEAAPFGGGVSADWSVALAADGGGDYGILRGHGFPDGSISGGGAQA